MLLFQMNSPMELFIESAQAQENQLATECSEESEKNKKGGGKGRISELVKERSI